MSASALPDPDADWAGDFLDARKARLDDILEDIGTKKLVYLYDFGDGWEHTITIERITDPEPGGLSAPDRGARPLSSGKMRRPLSATLNCSRPSQIASTNASRADRMDRPTTSIPKVDDAEALIAEVAALAESWSRKSARKRSKST